MKGAFELFNDEDKHFRFRPLQIRLTGPDGTLTVLSGPFPDKAAAVAGITAVRESAGTGLITLHRPSDHSRTAARTATALSTAPPVRPGVCRSGAPPKRRQVPGKASVTPPGQGRLSSRAVQARRERRQGRQHTMAGGSADDPAGRYSALPAGQCEGLTMWCRCSSVLGLIAVAVTTSATRPVIQDVQATPVCVA